MCCATRLFRQTKGYEVDRVVVRPKSPSPHTPYIHTPIPPLRPLGRERLIRQHLDQGRCLAELAAENGISERTAHKWLERFRSGEPAALADRSSNYSRPGA